MNFSNGLLTSYSYPERSYTWNGTPLSYARKSWESGNFEYEITISNGYVTYTQVEYEEQGYWTGAGWTDRSSAITTSGARIDEYGTFESGYRSKSDQWGTWYYATTRDQDGNTIYLYTQYDSYEIYYLSYDSSMPAQSDTRSVTWYYSDTVQYGIWLNDGCYVRRYVTEMVPGQEEDVTGSDCYYDTYNQERSYCYVYKLDGTQVSLGYTPNRVYFEYNAVGTGSSSNRHYLEDDEYASFVFNGTTRYLYQGKVYSTRSVTSSSRDVVVNINRTETPNAADRTFYFSCNGADGSTSLTGSPGGRDRYVTSGNSSILFTVDGEIQMIGNDTVEGIVRVKYSSGGMVFANGYLISDHCYTL